MTVADTMWAEPARPANTTPKYRLTDSEIEREREREKTECVREKLN